MLFCWGDQAWGQIAADGTREGLVQVGNDTDWRSIAGDADIDRDLLRYQDRGALVLGRQQRWDQLGQGEDFIPSNDSSPIQVGTDTDWATVELHLGGACALKEMAPSGVGATPWALLPIRREWKLSYDGIQKSPRSLNPI